MAGEHRIVELHLKSGKQYTAIAVDRQNETWHL
jgi:hypothetical protein